MIGVKDLAGWGRWALRFGVEGCLACGALGRYLADRRLFRQNFSLLQHHHWYEAVSSS